MPRKTDQDRTETLPAQQQEAERPEIRTEPEAAETRDEDHAPSRERGGRYGDGWW